jgi:hypothetical protein
MAIASRPRGLFLVLKIFPAAKTKLEELPFVRSILVSANSDDYYA